MTTDLHESIRDRLGRSDQRYTSSRQRLIEILVDAGTPLTVNEIVDRAGDLALSSAYRNLTVLEDATVIHRIVTHDDHARFELTEQLTGHHHHHLVCRSCGDVLDFELPRRLEVELDAALDHAAKQHRFVGLDHRLDLIGICDRCR